MLEPEKHRLHSNDAITSFHNGQFTDSSFLIWPHHSNFQCLQVFIFFYSALRKVDPPVGMNVEFKSEEMAQDALNGSSSGLAQGGSYVGVEQNFFGSFRLQYAGNRLLALARPSEVFGLWLRFAVIPRFPFQSLR